MTWADIRRLGELLDVQSGFAFKKEYFSDSRGIPLVRIRDLASATTETMYDGPYRDEFLVEPGDYLIGMDGEFRCHIWRGPRALLNQRVCRLRRFGRDVEPIYVYYRIQKHLEDIEDHTAFATVKHISAGQIANIAMPVPSVVEQRRMVDLMSRAENIVRMRREAATKAKEIIPALFVDMFGDPATNPKGWVVRTLGTVAEVVSGVAKGRKLNGRATRDVPYLRVANVQAGRLDLKEIKTIAATSEEIEEISLRLGDVLLTEGGDHDKLGRGALLDQDIGECIHQNHVFRVRANRAALAPAYFVSFLQTDPARAYFLKSAKRTTNLASINMTQLRGLPVLVPPVSEQQIFERRFASCRRLETDQGRAATFAEETFQSLLAGVFGEG